MPIFREDFLRWFAGKYPNIDFSSLPPDRQSYFQYRWEKETEAGFEGPKYTEEVIIEEPERRYPSDYNLYEAYKAAGGMASYSRWVEIGRPTGPGEGVGKGGYDPPPPPPPPPIDDPIIDDPIIDDPIIDDGDDDFSQQLAAAVERIRQESRELYEFERGEAQRLGARRTGKMSYEQRQALLARGRTPAEIEQLMAGGQEAAGRSLNDLLQALSIGQKQQQARIGEIGIGAMISGEELGIREQQLAQQSRQYQQSFAEQRRQFGVGTGLSQQQLAQQAQYQQGQLGVGRQQAEAGLWGPLFGALGAIGGGALGTILSPGAGTTVGAGVGAGIGQWIGPGSGGWFGGRV